MPHQHARANRKRSRKRKRQTQQGDKRRLNHKGTQIGKETKNDQNTEIKRLHRTSDNMQVWSSSYSPACYLYTVNQIWRVAVIHNQTLEGGREREKKDDFQN